MLRTIFFLFSSMFSVCLIKASDYKGNNPNIIFIMADDLGYGDLGCYGQERIKTPNIDKLASEGIRFTQAYAGGPVCTPSRSVLMTGLHNGHTPARDNIPHYSTYLQEDDVTVAEILKQAGYRCGGVGKWSLGDAGTVGAATNQGFDMWFGYLNQDHAHYYYTEYLDDSYRPENNYRCELPGNTETKQHYSHNLITDRALQFIRDSHSEPFFLYVAFTLPHFSSRSEDEDRFTVPSTEPYGDKNWDEQSKKYAAMVHMLDRDAGRIVDLVDELGMGDNTLIIFTSDNGGHSAIWTDFNTNGPFRGYKGDLTEGGIRVPFIARWSGRIPEGKTSNEIIAFQDMMSTFAELAGVTPPETTDGISVVNRLTGKKQAKKHKYLYWDYGHCRDRYDQAVRFENWKGIRLGQHAKIQLYDLNNDMGETNDLAESYPEIVSKIEKIMDEAHVPSERYSVGVKYQGGPIWKKNNNE
ncbi:N-acetylgalactosamine 6-sulfate sulfatase [Mariniphaga sediminis]|uniref:N-acetylgalactosamine 6-sulfate sulfatase n=1 Tax=Mariniphaga sediminis TaxID=1628158 RepID=A0A399D1K1_9BACT|nr:arylsulfatase [Mariniphaga sediminis]RIH65529.1 N-acetylgalactosamine 6-sulfate sulfatase [Mariniphaga sediminis]